MRDRNDRNIADIFQFISVFPRNKKCLITFLFGRNNTRQQSIYPFESSIKPKLSKKEKLSHPLSMIKLAIMNKAKQSHCHRKIKRRSDFSQMRRRKIEDKLSLWQVDPYISKSGSDAVLCFLDTCIWKSNNLDRRKCLTRICFNTNLMSDQSEIGKGLGLHNHRIKEKQGKKSDL